MARLATIALAGAALALAACGSDESGVTETPTAAEAPARPAPPPKGWRTHADRDGGLTLALPGGWSAERSGGALRVRAPGRALVAVIQADRSDAGRTTPAGEYALAALAALPGYRELEGRTARAPDSPYEAARATATGTRAGGDAPQHVSVTALRVPGTVTVTAVAFSEPAARAERRALDRALATLRLAQRSGRSG